MLQYDEFYEIIQAMKLDICPQCRGTLRAVKKECLACGLKLEADFEEGPLALLSGAEHGFILDFVLCGGSLKALGERRGLSYPTVRSRLDRIIERLQEIQASVSAEGIIDAVDRGELPPGEAARRLRRLKRER